MYAFQVVLIVIIMYDKGRLIMMKSPIDNDNFLKNHPQTNPKECEMGLYM